MVGVRRFVSAVLMLALAQVGAMAATPVGACQADGTHPGGAVALEIDYAQPGIDHGQAEPDPEPVGTERDTAGTAFDILGEDDGPRDLWPVMTASTLRAAHDSGVLQHLSAPPRRPPRVVR